MNIKMNGKKIQKIVFSNGESQTSSDKYTLWLSATYHGDRDEFWVINEEAGKEIDRSNCKYIETIIWA